MLIDDKLWGYIEAQSVPCRTDNPNYYKYTDRPTG